MKVSFDDHFPRCDLKCVKFRDNSFFILRGQVGGELCMNLMALLADSVAQECNHSRFSVLIDQGGDDSLYSRDPMATL